MLAEMATVASAVTDGKEMPVKRRAMRSNNPWRAVSANTARGRRVVDLARQYLQRGSHIETDAAISVAELVEAAEYARAEARRPGVSIAEVDAAARITASAERRLWRLFHPELPPAPPPGDDELLDWGIESVAKP
jgi:hypothetical protein